MDKGNCTFYDIQYTYYSTVFTYKEILDKFDEQLYSKNIKQEYNITFKRVFWNFDWSGCFFLIDVKK